MNDVVVGVDQSDTARKAFEAAASLAHDLGVNLHVVTCVKPGAVEVVGVGSDKFNSDLVSEAEAFLQGLVRGLANEHVTNSVSHGSPAAALCDEARRLNARMIVVGNRRVQGVSRVLGSIATDVARHASCGVFIANTVSG